MSNENQIVIERLLPALKRISSSRNFWLNGLALFLCFLTAFGARLFPSSHPSDVYRVFDVYSKILLLILSLGFYCILSVLVFEFVYLRAFKFKGKYFLTDKYIWALTLPFALAFMLQIGFEIEVYLSFLVIYSFIISTVLAVFAHTKGLRGAIPVWLGAPLILGYFISFGVSFILWMSFSVKLIRLS